MFGVMEVLVYLTHISPSLLVKFNKKTTLVLL
nr:MAG TPA: CRM1 / Exportin repeat 2 [Bacteriophage sp.]